MFNQKNYLLNCDVCDTRKMKEEDYSSYEKIMINADVVLVSPSSKSILNRLPVTINQDCTIEVADDIPVALKTVNGSYEITGATAVQEHTLLIVNGTLCIHPGTEESLQKYEKILVNGSVRYPQSLEGHLTKLTINGAVSVYPDDCVVLEHNFMMDKYFPLRAREGQKYYAQNRVILQDKSVDIQKLVQKKLQFVTRQLIVPEEMAEACASLFDEKTEFIVIPAGMTLHYGNTVLNKQLLEKSGGRIYLYGNLEIPDDMDCEALSQSISELIVKGNVILSKKQEEAFRKLNATYNELQYKWEGRIIENKPHVKIDGALLKSSPDKLLVKNTATINIAADVTPDLILNRLMIENCAKVSCNEEQESAVAVIAKNVPQIGDSQENGISDMMNGIKDLLSTKLINADSYIM